MSVVFSFFYSFYGLRSEINADDDDDKSQPVNKSCSLRCGKLALFTVGLIAK